MDKFREIESKFFLFGTDYQSAIEDLREMLLESSILYLENSGSGLDKFWEVDNDTFIRVREYSKDEKLSGVLSMKSIDKETIINRFETNTNLVTSEDLNNATAMVEALYGPSEFSIWKEYTIFNISEYTNISIYKTNEINIPLILEVEGSSESIVKAVSRMCDDLFTMIQSDQSLFELTKEVSGG